MQTQHVHSIAHANNGTSLRFALPSALLIGFGATLFIITSFYLRDLAMLAEAPMAVWMFICGVPTTNAAVAPLLIGFSGIAILTGLGLMLFARLRQR